MATPAAEAPLEYSNSGTGSQSPGGDAPPSQVPNGWLRTPRRPVIAFGATAVIVAVIALLTLTLGRGSNHPDNLPPAAQTPPSTLTTPSTLPSAPAVTAPTTIAPAPAVTTPTTNATAAAVSRPFGVYPGDGTAAQEVTAYKALSQKLGRTIPYVVLMGDARSEAAFRGSVFGHFVADTGWRSLGPDRPAVVISVPLAFGAFTPRASVAKANLRKAALGAYDGSYRYLASALLDAGYPAAIIRLGWEFDANWMPWTAQADPQSYAAAFRHVHDVFASVSGQFRFDWTSAAGYEHASSGGSYSWLGAMDWSAAYPGDAYVDIIGVDLYDQNQHQPYDPAKGTWTDPQQAWRYESTPLTAQRDFAISHKKQVSYPEWALTAAGEGDQSDHGGDNPTFIQGMADWFASLPAAGAGSLAYQAYFEDTQQPEGIHAIERFSSSYARFTQLFGR